MTALHETNTLNIEASMYGWMTTQLNALDKPSWLPSFSLAYDAPEDKPSYPEFSMYHIPISGRKPWQGSQGARHSALLEVSAWVTRGNQNYAAQLRTMRAFIEQIFSASSTVQVTDYLSDPSSPSAVSYKIDIMECNYISTAPDPNPDIERARYLIRYEWTQRAN